jgi:hypothetical protein
LVLTHTNGIARYARSYLGGGKKISQQRGFGTSAEHELNIINEKIQNEHEEIQMAVGGAFSSWG